MGCSCNRGGNATYGAVQAAEGIMRAARQGTARPAQSNQLEKIVVNPEAEMHNIRYVAPPTGTAYILASVGPRSEQFVHQADAQYFTSKFPHLFQYAPNAGVSDQSLVSVAD
jgi:hypothetical protein